MQTPRECLRGSDSFAEGSKIGLEQGEELEHREALRRLPDIRGGIEAANWSEETSSTLGCDSR